MNTISKNNYQIEPTLLRRHHFLTIIGTQRWVMTNRLKSDTLTNNSGKIVQLGDDWQQVFLRALEQNNLNLNQPMVSDLKLTNTFGNKTNIDDNSDNIGNDTINHLATLIEKSDVDTHIHTPVIEKKVICQLLPELLVGIEIIVPAFDLSAIRYQNWLIVVDNKKMDTMQLSIWQSLSEKLAEKAGQDNQLWIKNSLKYPFNADWKTTEGEEQLVLSGFLWRLLDKKPPQKMAILTDMDTVIFGQGFAINKQITPTLLDMATNPAQKKVFWQMLHA